MPPKTLSNPVPAVDDLSFRRSSRPPLLPACFQVNPCISLSWSDVIGPRSLPYRARSGHAASVGGHGRGVAKSSGRQ